MSKGKNTTDEILKASHRVELFVRKIEKTIQKAVTYESDKKIKNDIEFLAEFVETQRKVIHETRTALQGVSDVYVENYLDREISATPLSTRTFLCLRSGDIRTVRELLAYKEKHGINGLLRFRNFGTKSFDEVVNFINAVETL
ncbi:DNA-directed RNA polymerase subunit alpha C-terminal domain-containing protein [Dyadobacter bucti]|uniref:DNA-directed RNA polymerase subunit alpha C-terminal domain-containing protein n=1 Tax=Dyadobacter bucti TaxID=2572203 RepID=UPI0011084E70|nr:DNA-directed RNA polymerase subunit alpha C-terminal domain-containing protein [Dyadobacter bucti]